MISNMNKKQKKEHKINKEIRNPEVRLVGEGIAADVYPIAKALEIAEGMSMDLVLINENSQPPVCKLMVYEKFLYELSKKPKQKVLDMKEIRLSPNTSDNDLSYRIKQIQDFLTKGHKVRISLQFRGREMVYVDKGKAMLLKLALDLETHGAAEALPNLEGKKMFLTIKPKTK